MKIIKAKDYNDMSRKAANIISAQVIMKPDCVLGLATGCLLYTSAKAAMEHAKKQGMSVVILDTAGRLHIDEAMMEELQEIKANVHVDYSILVVDSMTGQDAVNVATTIMKIFRILSLYLLIKQRTI